LASVLLVHRLRLVAPEETKVLVRAHGVEQLGDRGAERGAVEIVVLPCREPGPGLGIDLCGAVLEDVIAREQPESRFQYLTGVLRHGR
jgi:hypothetical protein